jgi:diguanylate cyclase (GGDEF)-like protein/PAS domain S-box-containing protein
VKLVPILAVALVTAATAVAWLLARLRHGRRALESLRVSEGRYRALVQRSPDATLILSPDGVITFASPAATQTFGRPASTLEGERLLALVHPDDASKASRFLDEASGGGGSVGEWRVRGATGAWHWVENSAADLRRDPAVAGLVLAIRDITERRTVESRLTHQAFHDALTRLANRSLFLNRVGHALARAPRAARPSAVLFLDLDDFKRVNDSLGHAVGDELLLAAAGRLSTCVRPGDTIARLGGDEFAVLLDDLEGAGHAEQIAERIASALRTPFRLHGRDVLVGVSIGIAPLHGGETPEDVLHNADLAMYSAKATAKGGWATYNPAMRAQVLGRLELEADLRAAVAAGDIRVEYQPIVHLESGEMVGAEALVRWHHASRGHVAPSRFVSVAEETGLIVPIGKRVLEEACGRAREWRDMPRAGASTRSARSQLPSAAALRVSVNISARHFHDVGLVADVESALRATDFPPSALSLEITESVLMQRSEETFDTLRRLKALGVQLAIDNFGTGSSSLGTLQQLPIDMLKIDRAFVEPVGAEGRDPVLVRAILAIGATMGLATVAEGIERPAQRAGLHRLGCAFGQGFLFARPMTAEGVVSLLTAPPAPSWVGHN